jgi:hypothetical protein
VPEWVRLFEDPGEPVNVREVVAATLGTPAGEAERLTAVLRELGWRWATREEVLGLAGYLVPGLGGAPRATDGSTRTWVLRDLT